MSGRALGGRALGVIDLLVNLFSKLHVTFSGLLSYLVGMKRMTNKSFICKRDNSHFLHYLKIPSIMLLGIFLYDYIPVYEI